MCEHTCAKVVVKKIDGGYLATSLVDFASGTYSIITYKENGQLLTAIKWNDIHGEDEELPLVYGPVVGRVYRAKLEEHHIDTVAAVESLLDKVMLAVI